MRVLFRERGVRLIGALFMASLAGSAYLAWTLLPLSNGTDEALYDRFYESR